MNKERFERVMHISLDTVDFRPHYSEVYETAVVGRFVIYHNLEEDTYVLTLDNSVCKCWHDLSKEVSYV